MTAHRLRPDCRICAGTSLVRFLDLGKQPLANAFTSPARAAPEERYPLAVYVCEQCWHVQLLDVVAKETLFAEYSYMSTTSQTIPAHFAALAREVEAAYLAPDDLVVEIGSNDGVLLRAFQGRPYRILGVEPASNIAKIAQERGVPTLNAFFHPATAAQVAAEHGRAKVVLANNVVGHIDDLPGLAAGVRALLRDDGAFVFEVPYLVDLLDKLEFDTVYHEHLSYFAIRPLQRLLGAAGLEIVDVTRQGVHGGTIRVHARPHGTQPVHARVGELVALERGRALDSLRPYHEFAAKVEALRADLVRTVRGLRAQGKRIAGYGAPAKGNTLLNYCGFGPADIEFIQDTTPLKQGRLAPGTRIPVVPPEHFRANPPDVAFMLAWNYEAEILAKESKFREAGGRFLIPIPSPRLV